MMHTFTVCSEPKCFLRCRGMTVRTSASQDMLAFCMLKITNQDWNHLHIFKTSLSHIKHLYKLITVHEPQFAISRPIKSGCIFSSQSLFLLLFFTRPNCIMGLLSICSQLHRLHALTHSILQPKMASHLSVAAAVFLSFQIGLT